MNKRWYKKVPKIDYIEGNKGWYINEYLHGLYEIDLLTMESKLLSVIESDYNNYLVQFRIGCKCDKYIVLLPCYQSKDYRIGLLDLDNNEIIDIRLNNKDLEEDIQNGYTLFSSVYADGETVYLMGGAYPSIVKLNISNKEIAYISGWYEELKKSHNLESVCSFLGWGVLCRNDIVYVPMSMMQALVKVDLTTLETEIVDLDINEHGCSKIIQINDNYALLDEYGEGANRIFVWDFETDKIIKEIEVPSNTENILYSQVCVSFFCLFKGKVYFTTNSGRPRVLSLNTESWMLEEIIDFSQDFGEDESSFVMKDFLFLGNVNGKLACVTGKDVSWHVFDEDSGCFNRYNYELSDKVFAQTLKFITREEVISEEMVSAEFFVNEVI